MTLSKDVADLADDIAVYIAEEQLKRADDQRLMKWGTNSFWTREDYEKMLQALYSAPPSWMGLIVYRTLDLTQFSGRPEENRKFEEKLLRLIAVCIWCYLYWRTTEKLPRYLARMWGDGDGA